MKPAESTQTEMGQQLFLDEVRKLPGILRAETFGGRTLGEQVICVYVRREDLETEYAVYDLKGRVYEKHPDARLSVEVCLEDATGDADAPASDTVATPKAA